MKSPIVPGKGGEAQFDIISHEDHVVEKRKKAREPVKKKKGKKDGKSFHAFVDAARFAGGGRSLERRAVTGAWPRLFDRC